MATDLLPIPVWEPLLEALQSYSDRSLIRSRDRVLRPLRKKVEKAWARFFRQQGMWWMETYFVVVRSLMEADLPDSLERAVARLDQYDDDRAIEATLGAVRATLESSAGRAIASLAVDASFDLANPRAVHYMEQVGANLVRGLNRTSRDRLRTLLAEGIENGWSYTRLAGRVQALFADFSRSRALTIARTELGNAYSEGTVIVGDMLRARGLQVEKRWVAVQNQPGEPCLVNANQGWIPMQQVFASGDMRPLQHPRCRCALVLRTRGVEDAETA